MPAWNRCRAHSMRIRWTFAAAADLQEISNYLKDHHPWYRRPTIRKIYDAVGLLKDWPNRGLPDVSTEHENFCFHRHPTLRSIGWTRRRLKSSESIIQRRSDLETEERYSS
jgi:plasmid stabilization system protein ParE